jgi:hypothetical protein
MPLGMSDPRPNPKPSARHVLSRRDVSSLPDNEAVYREWGTVVVHYGVMGVQVHDARFAAAMRVNRVSHIVSAIY